MLRCALSLLALVGLAQTPALANSDFLSAHVHVYHVHDDPGTIRRLRDRLQQGLDAYNRRAGEAVARTLRIYQLPDRGDWLTLIHIYAAPDWVPFFGLSPRGVRPYWTARRGLLPGVHDWLFASKYELLVKAPDVAAVADRALALPESFELHRFYRDTGDGVRVYSLQLSHYWPGGITTVPGVEAARRRDTERLWGGPLNPVEGDSAVGDAVESESEAPAASTPPPVGRGAGIIQRLRRAAEE